MPDSNPPPPRSPELHAVSLIQDAESYRRAASVLAQADLRSTTPTCFLLCHASEPALKAFLATHGMTDWQLTRHDLRHNLHGLFEATLPLGFKPPDDSFGDLMGWLSEFHSEHMFRNRPAGGRLLQLPIPAFVADELKPVIAGIEGIVRVRYAARRKRVE